MTCEGCVRSVTRTLQSVPGVREVQVSLKDARARVTFDSTKASVAELKGAVERAGYEAP